MSDSNNEGAFVTVYWILTIVLSIFAGILSWNWVKPDGFMDFIGFLLIWGVLSSVGHFLAMGLVAMFTK